MGSQVGLTFRIEILFQVVALPLDLLGDGCCVGGQFMTTKLSDMSDNLVY